MSNEEIAMRLQQCRSHIEDVEIEIRDLFEQLKKNYPIQPGDKVRITTKVKNRSTGKAEPDNVQEGQCIELAVHYDDTIRLICYPYKANGEVSSKGKIWISHDTTVEKI
jgi:hypothetical protein